MQPVIKPIAIVLPQFHPIPENDKWWGKGFTEWRNVVKARARFHGHYQPQLPQDFGYYDMRLPKTRLDQATLAAAHGVYGFCYYHYWFSGRRLLQQPVEELLKSGEPNFPYMLCWANENWSRNWDGGFGKILVEQIYSREDFNTHARDLAIHFRDERYILAQGRPVFAIYKPASIPNLADRIAQFREAFAKCNVNPLICYFSSFDGNQGRESNLSSIFDYGIEMQPHSPTLPPLMSNKWRRRAQLLRHGYWPAAVHRKDIVLPYEEVVLADISRHKATKETHFPSVCPAWDNSARRKTGALILHGSTPKLFQRWVRAKIDHTDWSALPESYLFINAWNEWAEGNHLEPCEQWGCAYLEALQAALLA